MKSLWNDKEAKSIGKSALAVRVYTSRLLGREPALVLHGGGNTSVKTTVKDYFGDDQEVLFVKGSGWDLATIEKEGFAPVKLEALKRMAGFENLTDTEMVRLQRAAMTDPSAPNPSVEAILHAIIPFKYVDHTHADSVVTITNTPKGKERIEEIYSGRILIVPYVMPGFILSKKVFEMTKDVNWGKLDGIILMNHGVFTFADNAKESYEKMIAIVSKAEKYLEKKGAAPSDGTRKGKEDLLALATIRKKISVLRGAPVLARARLEGRSYAFSLMRNIERKLTGPLTPDHVIRTKRLPVVLHDNIDNDLKNYDRNYRNYFKRYALNGLRCLDTAPRWAVWPAHGTICSGRTVKELNIIADITDHTMDAVVKAERLGGYRALGAKDIFEVEYWDLEQAKLKKVQGNLPLQGQVALVTGAARGIGRACVAALREAGAAVVAADKNPEILKIFISDDAIVGIESDLTRKADITACVQTAVRSFGGLDIMILNAGIFPASESIESLKEDTWKNSMDINLSSHQALLSTGIPYLKLGVDPAVVVIASKNVLAPGPGASAYSVAKAGLTQLARVAALELAPAGIRVNIIHPNQVFDTGIWTDEVLLSRARQYGLTVEEYKKNNLLKVEISSRDVAGLACAMAGPLFSKTTGSQVTIDGGNERVI